jgi:hypothetical protein
VRTIGQATYESKLPRENLCQFDAKYVKHGRGHLIVCGRPRHRWDRRILLKLKKQGRRVWIGFTWLRIRASGRLL